MLGYKWYTITNMWTLMCSIKVFILQLTNRYQQSIVVGWSELLPGARLATLFPLLNNIREKKKSCLFRQWERDDLPVSITVKMDSINLIYCQLKLNWMVRNEDKNENTNPHYFFQNSTPSFSLFYLLSLQAVHDHEEWGVVVVDTAPFCCFFLLTFFPAPTWVLSRGCSPSGKTQRCGNRYDSISCSAS